MIAAILATGPSMSAAVAERAGAASEIVVAVNDSFRLAPWADALVAQDYAWWDEYRAETDRFLGRKFSGNRINGVEQVEYSGGTGTNSGALAIFVAATRFSASEILLFGFDMAGGHFFGEHPARLKGTSERRRATFQEQFFALRERLDALGVVVRNCTPGSLLKAFPA